MRDNQRKLKYFFLEPDAFLTDIDFIAMSAKERGAYCTLLFYLYSNQGRIKFDINSIRNLTKIHGNSNMDRVLNKFNLEDGYLTHKRVSHELECAEARVNSAVTAANILWKKHIKTEEDYATALQPHCYR